MFNIITNLANFLDEKGFTKLANKIDDLIKKALIGPDACSKCGGDGVIYKKTKDPYGNIHEGAKF